MNLKILSFKSRSCCYCRCSCPSYSTLTWLISTNRRSLFKNENDDKIKNWLFIPVPRDKLRRKKRWSSRSRGVTPWNAQRKVSLRSISRSEKNLRSHWGIFQNDLPKRERKRVATTLWRFTSSSSSSSRLLVERANKLSHATRLLKAND